MAAFKAYDFRGKYDIDFTTDDIYKIGFFLPELLNTKKVLIGYDMRVSTPVIYEALCKGVTDAGADVYDMGLCTTPMVYFFTAKHHFEASVMITASHNPKEYNGLKISRKDALPVGYETGLSTLEKMVKEDEVKPVAEKGKVIDYPVKDEYIRFLTNYKCDISNLKIGMDCSNGMASVLVKDIFGDQPHYIFDTLDGTFPNHEANPLEPENVEDLQKLVKEMKADIGVVFDGDADRVMFVDEKGNFIPPDLMIAVLSYYFIEEKNVEGKVIVDIRTSKSTTEFIEKKGREVFVWKVGRAFAAMKMREIDGAFGGEFAGHYYFRDFFYSDSAMMAALIILHIVSEKKKEGVTLSEIISQIKSYANSGEINFRIEDKTAAMKLVVEHFTAQEKPSKVMDFDGYRIEFADWWFNIRPSNTEPYLRLLMEAKTEKLLAEKLKEMEKLLATVK
ncbi:phosphomannomutase/phosphoglucomutase [Bacteroidales bacterium OttesenSCG-928-B11]|nr:phosphomannomutase/phosphoglucomutase [Bacteroidales bacterium OttesenSCG-928-C03]MDL2311593.1 phosphomannomutase/phosphoglucomutase [Bacteroidales bacterium OttesenSCG-928-B11]